MVGEGVGMDEGLRVVISLGEGVAQIVTMLRNSVSLICNEYRHILLLRCQKVVTS